MSTNCSGSIRASNMRALRSSKKSILYADFQDDRDCGDKNLAHRSISLSALSHATTVPANQQITLEPRMAQLETLEARMASIEVSLSTAPRRKNGKKSVNGSISGSTKPSTPVPKTASTLVESCKELEMLRHVLRDKENTIQNLQGQVVTSPKPLDANERRIIEQKLQQLRLEEEMRRNSIIRVTDALKQINADDNNIDLRIRQAELEYELGREELALLGVREEKRGLQAKLDTKPSATLFSCLHPCGRAMVHAVSVECDPKSPKFGAGSSDDSPGLRVLWATEESGLKKGDRILEVNGKLTLSTTKEELARLLSVCPSRAELVVCRQYSPPASPDDLLRRENLRLTHRISYLEDQVADLLNFKEKALIPQIEVFQKGSQVTVLSSPESSRTGSQAIVGDMPSDSDQSWMPLSGDSVGPSQQYQENADTKRALNDRIKAIERRRKEDNRSFNGECAVDKERVPAVSTVYIQSPAHHALSDIERNGRRSKEIRNVDYSSETTCPRYRSHRDRSVKSLDLDANNLNQDAPTRLAKPPPPKKPLRLSIQRATSLQSMQMGSAAPRKSKHKGAAPPPPLHIDPPDAEVSYAALRWHFHKNRKGRPIHVDEKWC